MSLGVLELGVLDQALCSGAVFHPFLDLIADVVVDWEIDRLVIKERHHCVVVLLNVPTFHEHYQPPLSQMSRL